MRKTSKTELNRALYLIGDQTTVGKGKTKGTVTFRQGFFYAHGRTAMNFQYDVEAGLKRLGLEQGRDFEVLEADRHDKPFRGGGSCAQNSHFSVKVRLLGEYA
jgi:hypothetical protein